MGPRDHPAPTLEVTVGATEVVGPASYRVSFDITNRSRDATTIVDDWLPHSDFRAEKEHFHPAIPLAPGERLGLRREVHCPATPGSPVENAFLILLVSQAGKEWRVFTRLRIEALEEHSVLPIVEAITAQPVGFRANAG